MAITPILLRFQDFRSTEGWYVPGYASGASLLSTFTADRIFYSPIFLPREQQFTAAGIDVESASTAGGLLRGAIYEYEEGLPTSLVRDLGTFPIDSTGDKVNVQTWTLAAGVYFVASVLDEDAQLRRIGMKSLISAVTTSRSTTIQGFEFNNAGSFFSADPGGTVANGFPETAPVGSSPSFSNTGPPVVFRVEP